MKAAVLNELDGTFQVEEIEFGAPIGREVLVEVKASGLCHSDLHFAEQDFGVPLPAVLGHELAGIVVAVGPEVREFVEGDHVVGSLIQFCGHCPACIGGRTYQCTHTDETLRGADEDSRLTRGGTPVSQVFGTGAFAERALVHENQLAKVPKEIPFPQASLLGCGVITGAGAAINTAKVRPGDTVAVIGIGGVGLNVISGAQLAGAARIIAVDMQPAKEDLARKFGATDFVVASAGDPVEAVRALIEGGVDHAFEVVGIKPTSEQAIRMVRKGGGAYLIGVHNPASTIDVNVTIDLLTNQVELRGVYMGSSNIKHDIPKFANLYLQGKLNLDDLISREIRIDEINEAYSELKKGAIARSVITSF
ncbi:Zn-dependent alcohol dehydrogenase [Sphingomonas sp. CGMCC 1.13654]|uniref:Zn-dependent alcohol dehydrogenase n=1 Tax=Sphingomonas chungangi TaxID=2683589 RepID=A0A838LAA8_9SPHN|nr:Zn-dependent alcohol dehydrogenase [Sphingomonas chungangi]MBA2935519.1 Zn-dependent alcohol dehydrogenase [Sphingomonas chungangi]MVW57026.1 alcohol dehydrogenase catalytic domain-containing protein [Sphingomonas chungangi]